MEWFEREDFWRDFYAYMFSPDRFAAAKEEVSQVIALTQCSGGNLLDLCCGPGRHSVEFAQRGFTVTGVDRSAFLLDRAREHAAQNGIAVEWVQEDMRRFVRPARFDLICNLFTSFGYFETEQDDLLVLRNLYGSLKKGGVLMIDVLGKERLVRVFQNEKCFDLADGSLLLQRPQIRDDFCRVRTEWILIKDGHTRTATFEHNLYSGRELKDRLLSSGFSQVQLFGSFPGAPYDLNALRLIAVARKANS